MFRVFCVACLLTAFSTCRSASGADPKRDTNYDEAKVGTYVLPDPLTCADGSKVADASTWQAKRRPELLELFRSQMHGRSPARPADMRFETTSVDRMALDGRATRKEIAIHLGPEADAPVIHLLLYVPNGAQQPVPAFLGFNFDGNHTIDADPGIAIRPQWTWNRATGKEELTTPDAATRGASASRWLVPMIVGRGYATATIARANVEPDYAAGWRHGIRGYFLKRSGREAFADDDWGCIAAWAWSLSRALDYLATDPDVDAGRVVVHGHSRMGKTSLWAAAEDERFAAVISNNSGEGGAALARRNFGETTAVINSVFPHWFCGNYKQYSTDASKLPFDAHELVALAAPRPAYVASAQDDQWADPRGEFLAIKHAEPVYALFGRPGLGVAEFPGVDRPVGKGPAYHMRTGKHDINEYDWRQYLDFADRNPAARR